MSKTLTAAALAAGLFSQAPTTAFQRDGATPLIDNPRVAVWETQWTKNKSVAMHRYEEDTVLVPVTSTVLQVTNQAGVSRTLTLAVGDMVLWPKGTTQSETSQSDGRIVMTALKAFKAPPIQNHSPYPPAFPREGVKKLLENDRIVGWDYTWIPGKPTPMHFHDKDVVLTYVGAGALNSTTPDGTVSVNEFKFGETRFNPGNRIHFESYLRGDGPRAIIIELK